MKWISVKDKLPEDGQSVLVTVDLKHRRFVGTFFHHYHPLQVAKWISEAHPHYDFGYDNVTHWMPLPEPPESKVEQIKDQDSVNSIEIND